MALGFEQNLNMNTTTSAGVAPLYQPALNRHLLMRTKADLIHSQFGQKVPLPKGTGKIITWRKLSPLPKAKVPLTEGITPEGTAINVSEITASPLQYGNYISTTDQFAFFTPDPPPKVLELNALLADNAGETLDSLTADILSSGTNVQYAGGKTARASLTASDVLTIEDIKKAVRTLKGNKAKRIDGDYVAIVHTDVAYDLMNDPAWIEPHKYVDTKNIYAGEIGKMYGVRFVESPDAKKFMGELFAGIYDELQVARVDGKDVYIAETLDSAAANAMKTRKVWINGVTYTVSAATAGKNGEAKITLSEAPVNVAVDMKIYPGEGGANGRAVYSTLVIGKDAYGVTDPKGTLENITKPLGSAGTADPLN